MSGILTKRTAKPCNTYRNELEERAEFERAGSPVQRGSFKKNIFANILYFLVNLFLGIWFTPYLIKYLGVETYGFIPLFTNIAGYMSIVTLGINFSVGRYLAIAIEQNNHDSMNKIFNTSFFISVIITILLVIPCCWAIFNIEMLVHIPTEILTQARVTFACIVLAFLLNTIKTPFEVATFCFNRFDLRNILLIIEAVIRVGFVVVCFNSISVEIWHVGTGILIATCISFVGAVWVWKRLMPSLIVSYSYFDWSQVKDLTSMGVWVSISTVGSMLFLGIDLLVINRMFTVEDAGRYAAILQWPTLLRAIGFTISGVFAPTMIYYYARNDMSGLVTYTKQAVKFVGLLIALPVGLISGLSIPLLQLWIGLEYTNMFQLMIIMCFPLAFNLGYLPLHNICTATNKVKLPAIVQLVAGLLNLGLAILFSGALGWGLYGVAVAGVLVLTCRNIFFSPIYAAHILKQPIFTFMNEIFPIGVASMLISIGCFYVSTIINISSYFSLIVFGFFITIIYLLITYFFILTPDERGKVVNMIS